MEKLGNRSAGQARRTWSAIRSQRTFAKGSWFWRYQWSLRKSGGKPNFDRIAGGDRKKGNDENCLNRKELVLKLLAGEFIPVILSIIFWPAVLLAQGTDSQDNPWERFSLSLGGFITTLDSTVVLGAQELGTGIVVNVEDALNLDSDLTVFRGDAFVRLGSSQRHRLDFSYYDLRRSSTRTLTKDLEIGGNTYPIGTTVDSSLDFQIIKGGIQLLPSSGQPGGHRPWAGNVRDSH